jgi:hypothetical protein
MMNLLMFAFIFFVGGCVGAVLMAAMLQAGVDRKPRHATHMGLYGDPNLSYWFRMRAKESDAYWRTLPLNEYAKKKKLVIYGDTQ